MNASSLLFLASALLSHQADPNVRGSVIGLDGKPVVAARVGTTFQLQPVGAKAATRVQIGYGKEGILTNERGEFAINRAETYTGSLVALGEDGSMGFAPIQAGGLSTVI